MPASITDLVILADRVNPATYTKNGLPWPDSSPNHVGRG